MVRIELLEWMGRRRLKIKSLSKPVYNEREQVHLLKYDVKLYMLNCNMESIHFNLGELTFELF